MANSWEYDEELPDCECPQGVPLEIDDACAGCYYDEIGKVKPSPPPSTIIVIDLVGDDDQEF